VVVGVGGRRSASALRPALLKSPASTLAASVLERRAASRPLPFDVDAACVDRLPRLRITQRLLIEKMPQLSKAQ